MFNIFIALLMLLAMPSRIAVAQSDNTEALVFIKISEAGSGAQVNAGSGIILNKQGFIVTAAHLLEDYDPAIHQINVSLRSRNGTPLPAQKFNCASENVDVCILKLSPDDITSNNITNYFTLSCRDIGTQEKISAWGYPVGPMNTKNHPSGQVTGGVGEKFLMPAAIVILGGMSGGPVLDESGSVIGIVYGVAKDQTSFALFTPLQYAHSLIGDTGTACDSGNALGTIHLNSISGIDFRSLKGPDSKELASSPMAVTIPVELRNDKQPSPNASLRRTSLYFAFGGKTYKFQWYYFVRLLPGPGGTWLSSDQVRKAAATDLKPGEQFSEEIMHLSASSPKWSEFITAFNALQSNFTVSVDVDLVDKIQHIECNVNPLKYRAAIATLLKQHHRLPGYISAECET
jgi:hypothetical protein